MKERALPSAADAARMADAIAALLDAVEPGMRPAEFRQLDAYLQCLFVARMLAFTGKHVVPADPREYWLISHRPRLLAGEPPAAIRAWLHSLLLDEEAQRDTSPLLRAARSGALAGVLARLNAWPGFDERSLRPPRRET